jgi:hypothetical protein
VQADRPLRSFAVGDQVVFFDSVYGVGLADSSETGSIHAGDRGEVIDIDDEGDPILHVWSPDRPDLSFANFCAPGDGHTLYRKVEG